MLCYAMLPSAALLLAARGGEDQGWKVPSSVSEFFISRGERLIRKPANLYFPPRPVPRVKQTLIFLPAKPFLLGYTFLSCLVAYQEILIQLTQGPYWLDQCFLSDETNWVGFAFHSFCK